jgi:hypothetical protein
VRFKQNIPAIGLALLVVAVVAAFIFMSPSEEEQFIAAVRDYAPTLGTPVRVESLGDGLAEIELAPGKRLIWVEFTRQAGKWVFSKNLAVDFEKTLSEHEMEQEILGRLAKRISKRFPRFNISLKEGLQCFHLVVRESRGIIGRYRINFAYPEVEGRQLLGRYEETFRYQDGTWVSEGVGRLFEQPWQRPR